MALTSTRTRAWSSQDAICNYRVQYLFIMITDTVVRGPSLGSSRDNYVGIHTVRPLALTPDSPHGVVAEGAKLESR